MKIKKTIDIAANAEKIWPLLVEPANIMKWCGTVKRILHTGEQKSGLSASFYFEEMAVGVLMKLHFIVTEWTLYRSVAFQMTSGNFVKGYEQRYTLEPIPTGVRFTCTEDVKLPYGILGKFSGLIRRPRSEAHLERMLSRLKSIVEA